MLSRSWTWRMEFELDALRMGFWEENLVQKNSTTHLDQQVLVVELLQLFQQLGPVSESGLE